MRRNMTFLSIITILVCGAAPFATAGDLTGHYLEARTCQVYTGPCFAAGEAGLAGKEAVMAWKFTQGAYAGRDLSGLGLVAVVQTGRTLGFSGVEPSDQLRVRVIIDQRATDPQAEAMLQFLRARNPQLREAVADVRRAAVTLQLDTDSLAGHLDAKGFVTLQTRKANPDDCICSNESAYYPPLTSIDQFAPGVAIKFSARGIQRRWKTADTRNAYMGTFRVAATTRVAGS